MTNKASTSEKEKESQNDTEQKENHGTKDTNESKKKIHVWHKIWCILTLEKRYCSVEHTAKIMAALRLFYKVRHV